MTIHIQKTWRLYVDGASRNNPGHSGAGIVITCDNKPFLEHAYYLGIMTNNQAEYCALLLGFFLLESSTTHWSDNDHVHILSDSQLLIRQLAHIYRVRDAKLLPLYTCAQKFLSNKKYKLEHVMRENNTRADALANRGVDEKIPVPQAFNSFRARYCV